MEHVSLGYRSGHLHAAPWVRIPDGGLKYVADARPRLHSGGTGLQEVYEVHDLGDDRVAFRVVVAAPPVVLGTFLSADPDAGSDTFRGGAVGFADVDVPGGDRSGCGRQGDDVGPCRARVPPRPPTTVRGVRRHARWRPAGMLAR